MPQAVIAAPLVLALVLGAGGLLKLRDDAAATGPEWDAVGVPAGLNRRWARRAHPWGEIVLALALLALPGVLGVLAGLAAVVLCLAYLIMVAQGGASCNCFGADHATALTGWTVARTAVLLVLALLSVWHVVVANAPAIVLAEQPSARAWALAVVLAMAVTVLVAVPPSPPGSAVETAEAAAQTPPSGVAVMAPALDAAPEEAGYFRTLTPCATLKDAEGHTIDLVRASGCQAHLLVFLSPGCGPCSPVAPHMPEWVEQMPQLAVRAVVTTSPEALKDRAPDWAEWTYYDQDGMAGRMLQATGTPSAVLLGTDGMLAGGPVHGAGSVMEFVEDIKAQLGVA